MFRVVSRTGTKTCGAICNRASGILPSRRVCPPQKSRSHKLLNLLEEHSHLRRRADRKSSKCVHDGEPVFRSMKTLGFRTALIAKSFAIRFESCLGLVARQLLSVATSTTCRQHANVNYFRNADQSGAISKRYAVREALAALDRQISATGVSRQPDVLPAGTLVPNGADALAAGGLCFLSLIAKTEYSAGQQWKDLQSLNRRFPSRTP